MNIQSVRSEIPAEALPAKPKPKNANPEPQTGEVVCDKFTPMQNENLMQALRDEPDVRPEVVEKAKLLAADPDYPPKEVIGAIAKLFVQGIN